MFWYEQQALMHFSLRSAPKVSAPHLQQHTPTPASLHTIVPSSMISWVSLLPGPLHYLPPHFCCCSLKSLCSHSLFQHFHYHSFFWPFSHCLFNPGMSLCYRILFFFVLLTSIGQYWSHFFQNTQCHAVQKLEIYVNKLWITFHCFNTKYVKRPQLLKSMALFSVHHLQNTILLQYNFQMLAPSSVKNRTKTEWWGGKCAFLLQPHRNDGKLYNCFLIQ